MIAGTVFLGLLAYGLSIFLNTAIAPQIGLSVKGIALGVVATLPLAGFLWWFSATTNQVMQEFRQSQIQFFAEIGFEFTPLRILIIALAAGISEELLFRGVFQSWMSDFSPIILAVIIPNIIFGLLHMRTILYALIAGLVGIYLGIVFVATDNLLAPIVTHSLYDLVALIYTRQAIIEWRNEQKSAAS
ncbi:MAG: hypothetical protein DHS20C05_11690 [Hyphococcus sp.]|nr:MAG: hypothetical protein DHS20C05_11690 [Marinicaulis sp.]